MASVGRRPGSKFVCKLPRGRRVVGMVCHNAVIYVATDRHVYQLKGRKLIPLSFGYIK